MSAVAPPIGEAAGHGRTAALLRSSPGRRRIVDATMRLLSVAASLVILVPLVALVGYVSVRGIPAITPQFLTQTAELYDQGGALAAIAGTLQIVPLATLLAAPIGILGGIYLSEFAPPPIGSLIRLVAEVLTGIPSIVVGVFVYLVVVVPTGRFSAGAGIVALAVIMVPIILRSTEEFLRLVPATAREGALALGMSRWRMVTHVVLRAGLGGLVTTVLLALARAAGETAPVLMTALGSQVLNVGALDQPMDVLPIFIYHGAAMPSDILIGQAWGAAFLLLVFVLTTNLVVRAYASRRTFGGH